MGRHYRSPQRFFGRLPRLILLLVLAVALGAVLCRLYPDNVISQKTLLKSQEIAAIIKARTSFNSLKQSGTLKQGSVKISADAVAVSEDASGTNKPAHSLKNGEKPELALVIDDGGNAIDMAKRVADLDFPLTWAILPYAEFSKKTADIASAKKIPYLVHLPMQAEIDKDGGPYLIGLNMESDDIRKVTSDALDHLHGAIGLSNHRGSLATADRKTMSAVMDELKKRDLIFLDSRTSAKSVAYDAAKSAGLTALQNKGFLDGTPDKDAIEAKFNEAVKQTLKGRRQMILICHFRPATVLFLEKLNGRYSELPVRLVTIPEMYEQSSGTRHDEDSE